MPKVVQSIEINASKKKCYKVISDHEKYPEFVDHLSNVIVHKKRGNTSEVTHEVNLVKTFSYRIKLKGKPDEEFAWSMVSGDFMTKNEGRWILETVKRGVTKATYEVDIEFGLLVPGMISKMLVSSTLPSMLKAFKKRIESKK
jgi:ribosome-associated toxin RatA of RatAB toxin-antitoxin module